MNVWINVPDNAVDNAWDSFSFGTRMTSVEALTVCRTATITATTTISHQVSRPSASPTCSQSTWRSAWIANHTPASTSRILPTSITGARHRGGVCGMLVVAASPVMAGHRPSVGADSRRRR